AFPPDQARRLASKLEIHFTPKHGSWLNIAEIELRVLNVQCMNRRIADADYLHSQIHACINQRNASDASVRWQFQTDDARTHLRHLYPRFQS
ncbi:MAG TPA: transposase, partial [Rhodothermia bacterium]|nr:transposase [Rhodothermia bacterium]